MPIKDQETYALMNALDILNQFPEFEQNDQVTEIIYKLKRALDITDEMKSNPVIDFEKVEYPASAKWINQLYGFVKERQPLHLDYKPFTLDEYRAAIVPLLLKEYNGRWFLIAWELGKKQFQNYALDRIVSMSEYYLDITKIKIDFDAEGYFYYVVGVTKNEKGPVGVRFKTSDYMKSYFLTKKLHHSQELVDELSNTFEIFVEINIELTSKLLSYGEDLIVLEPESLRKTMTEKVQILNKLYNK